MSSDPESSNNPFCGLFYLDEQEIAANETVNNHCIKINDLIEKIFFITIDKNVPSPSKPLILMEKSADQDGGDNLINLDMLPTLLFERLLMLTPTDYLMPNDIQIDDQDAMVTEKKCIKYLYQAYVTCVVSKNTEDASIIDGCEIIHGLILRNIVTSLKQPDLYESQELSKQWLEVLKNCDGDYSDICKKFLIDSVKELCSEEHGGALNSLRYTFYPMLNEVLNYVQKSNIITLNKWILPLIHSFVMDKTVPQLAEILIDFTTPQIGITGNAYSGTLIGQLLSISILPKYANGPYEFYENASEASVSSVNNSLWNCLTNHLNRLYTIFKSMLIMGEPVKTKLLTWIGQCLFLNIPRGQIWATHSLDGIANMNSSCDAFMLNLCGVLLRLCTPLFKPDFKVLLVDPTYYGVLEENRKLSNVHLMRCSEETCLIPIDTENGNVQRLTSDTYNFITECFFMTHKAIDLSYRVCVEKFTRMSRNIHRLQNLHQDNSMQNGQHSANHIMDMINIHTQQFLCLKNTIIEPNNDKLLLQFYEATSVWLVAITAKTSDDIKNFTHMRSFAPKELTPVSLPLDEYVPFYLKSVPEHILENIVCYLTFTRNFDKYEHSVMEYDESQNEIFKMILVFMGSVERVKNPHLRARLAEGLDSLLPKDIQTNNFYSTSFKRTLFDCHIDRLQIIPNLLHVFVSIEMTGQSVQFEQKFNYRRPMYRIMQFLWKNDEQKQCFKELAEEAEQNMEAVEPPIFLRFINLLINDAIFLLDESLSNLKQIRQLQTAQDNGEWDNLPRHELQQNIADLQHLGMITKFDNILGRDTIGILQLLTKEIKGIFCHETIVNRMVSMLNYFLLSLVGPNKRNFKVKDKKEYEFDPANTVLNICRIYINFKASKNFCLAVSQDGRSYSSELFDFAEKILIRIGGGLLIGEMREFSDQVKLYEKQYKEDQEALVDVPDEYLDPIMSSLMTDPVILPSSHVIVDRSTIARHLLSDQSDPFNRSPLTMDQVLSNPKLKVEIEEWIQQKRIQYNERKSAEKVQSELENASN